MSDKNIPVYLGEEGDQSTQVGWASELVDGGRAMNIDPEHHDVDRSKLWYGEPDPNAPKSGDSDAEVNQVPPPADSAPIVVEDTAPPVVEEEPKTTRKK